MMAGVLRQSRVNVPNENGKTLKSGVSTRAGTNVRRPVLKNITNVDREVSTQASKKNDGAIKIYEDKKVLTKTKSSTSNLHKKAETAKIVKQTSVKEKNEKNVERAFSLEEEIIISDDDEIMDLAADLQDIDVEDIDEEDELNPLLCAEYVKDIYKYMKKREKLLQVDPYFSNQSEINEKMRSILVDWLIQVQSRFNLLQETLYLTIYLIDRFLSQYDCAKSELQLVGVTAMLVASKYEEMYAPEIGDFVYITDNAYSKTKIRAMEQKMLKGLDFDISNPLCLHFLRRNSKAGSVDAQKHTLAKYFMEIILVDCELALMLPSEVAASALYLSLLLIDGSPWTSILEHYSGYSEDYLLPTVSKMASFVLKSDASKYQAVKTKYAASKFMRISRLPELKGNAIKKVANLCNS